MGLHVSYVCKLCQWVYMGTALCVFTYMCILYTAVYVMTWTAVYPHVGSAVRAYCCIGGVPCTVVSYMYSIVLLYMLHVCHEASPVYKRHVDHKVSLCVCDLGVHIAFSTRVSCILNLLFRCCFYNMLADMFWASCNILHVISYARIFMVHSLRGFLRSQSTFCTFAHVSCNLNLLFRCCLHDLLADIFRASCNVYISYHMLAYWWYTRW